MRHSFLLVLLAIALITMQERMPQKNLRESTSFQFNEGFPSFTADNLAVMSFGYPHFLSNYFWIRFLQETPAAKVPKNEVSWMYYDLNSVLDIDPSFMPAAKMGGMFLSVITEDKIGAERILKKGTKLFPDDWQIQAYLGYHYQYELNDDAKAAESYAESAKLPHAPTFVALLAATLKTRTGNSEAAIAFLKQLEQETTNPTIKKKYEEKIRALKEKGLSQ